MELFYNQEKNFVRIVLSGAMNANALTYACDAALADPGYRLWLNRIWDVRAVDLTAVSTAEVQMLSSYLYDRPDGINLVKVALVAEEPLTFGLARVFATLSATASRNEVMPFRSLTEAETWVCAEEG
ncbi:hypothetical protein [Desulfogranum mediterraneum]|uniref:hypothetical protein n=1 Tax=Desulfogranum mediterraneum TaxID=160661 RepID=UPI00041A62A8|nr:hypothetical protein [Desulfogranum mediterraneum]